MNKIKIGDFGISKILENPFDFAETEVGTPYYLSPEICNGDKYSFKSDVWMLGCLLYEICYLKRPFEGESINMIMKNILNNSPDLITEFHNESYSKCMTELIINCLKKDPFERPNIQSILLLGINKGRKINEDYKLLQEKKNNNDNFNKKIIDRTNSLVEVIQNKGK